MNKYSFFIGKQFRVITSKGILNNFLWGIVLISVIIFAQSCEDPPKPTTAAGTLTCASISLNPSTLTKGVAYTGTLTIPYTGGNSGTYSAVQVSSNGLTASLPEGTISTSGNLVFSVSGTPTASGTFAISALGTSCSFSFTVNDPTPSDPTSATTTYPGKLSNCVAEIDGGVTFTWTAGQNTNSYDLYVRNLKDKTVQTFTNISTTTYKAALNLATPYQWWLVSKNATSNTAVSSDSTNTKFYLSGAAEQASVPFPADITSPANNAIIPSNTSFQWTGSDADRDLTSFEFWTIVNNVETKITTINVTNPNITASISESYAYTFPASLSSGTVVKWYIKSFDAKGNGSQSDVYTFTVQ